MATSCTLYLVVSGAPAPEGAGELVRLLHENGWRIAVLSTPNGTRFHDTTTLGELTGEQVRVEYRMPGTGEPLPPADAVLACPLTFTSTNKLTQGIADNFAIGLLCEMIGYGVPTVVVPHCKPQLASHPAFQRSLDTLASMPGVTVMHDPEAPYEQRMPPWRHVVETMHLVAGSQR